MAASKNAIGLHDNSERRKDIYNSRTTCTHYKQQNTFHTLTVNEKKHTLQVTFNHTLYNIQLIT